MQPCAVCHVRSHMFILEISQHTEEDAYPGQGPELIGLPRLLESSCITQQPNPSKGNDLQAYSPEESPQAVFHLLGPLLHPKSMNSLGAGGPQMESQRRAWRHPTLLNGGGDSCNITAIDLMTTALLP